MPTQINAALRLEEVNHSMGFAAQQGFAAYFTIVGSRSVKSILRNDSQLVQRINDRKHTDLCVGSMV